MTSSQDQDGPGLDGHQGTAQPASSKDGQSIPTPSGAPPQQEQQQGHEKEQEPAHPQPSADENNESKPAAGDAPPQQIAEPDAPQENTESTSADKAETMGDAVQTWLEAQPPPSQLAQPQADDDASARPIVTNPQAPVPTLPQQNGWDGNGTLVPDEMHMAATNLLMGSQAIADLGLPYLPYQLPVPGVHYNIDYAPENDADLDADSDDGDSIFDASRFPRMPRLRFEDSVFQFTTNTVIIGRDQVAYKRALASRKRAEKGLPSEEEGREPHGNYSKSYVSQSGGALGPESDGEERPRPSKRRKTAANGQLEDVPPPPRALDTNGHKAHGNLISSRQYVDHTPGAVPVDIDALRPSPDDVVKVQIHGPGPDIIATTKGISREHLKIQYNQRERIWQATPLGRNGFFCEDVLYGKNDLVTLRSGDELQIQSVTFIFDINGVPDGMLGNEGPRTYSEGGKEMSFDFQSSRGEEIMRDTSESLPSDAAMDKLDESDEEDDDDDDDADEDMEEPASPKTAEREDDEEGDADGEEDIRETVESDPPDHRDASKEDSMSANPEGIPHSLLPPKKRGPGRPPKNGIMSKREERELKKKAQEEAKKNAPPQEPGEPPIKRKVGRPRKHPLPEDADDQPEKRKYKPRKPKTEDGEAEEDPDGEKADKHKRLQKPKTPPLDLGDVKDWPEEKLQKPNKNYQLLIDEVLTAAPDGLTLKQIYKRIAKAYPYFHFKCDSKGWESSVRHNLIGSHCFQKNNETHLWKRVEGIPLDAGKKRKPSDSASEARPSPMYQGAYNPAYQHPPHQQYPNHQMPQLPGPPHANLPPRYPPNGQAYQVPATNPIQPGAPPHQQAAVRQGFPTHQPPAAIPQPNGYAAASATPRPQYTGTQPPTYNSTYNNRPHSTPLANAGVTGFPATQSHAQNSLLARPGQTAPGIPPNGLPVVNAGITQHPPRAISSPHQQQPVPSSAPPAPLGPVIDPSLRDFIRSFAREVVKQLQSRVLRPEAVAVSVVNRGLGLTNKSLTPEAESYEKAILNIFQAHKLTYSKPKVATASTTATATAPTATATAPSSVTSASAVNGNGAAPASVPAPPTPISAAAAPTVNGPSGAVNQTSGTGAVNGTAADGTVSSIASTGAAIPDSGNAGSTTPTPASAGTAPTIPTATGSTPSATVGAPTNPASSSPDTAPVANGSAVNRSSATPAPAPTPAPASGSPATVAPKDVQLLDPKLVELVQQYKKLSMEIIIPRVGTARGEILIMSAINRVLGFTDESIMSYKGEKNKEHLVDAEKALMQSLKHRIDTYLRCRRVSAAPTPAPVAR